MVVIGGIVFHTCMFEIVSFILWENHCWSFSLVSCMISVSIVLFQVESKGRIASVNFLFVPPGKGREYDGGSRDRYRGDRDFGRGRGRKNGGELIMSVSCNLWLMVH